MVDAKVLLGKKIKTIRAGKKITQEAFSEMIDLEPSSLSNIETGKSYPSMQTVLRLIEKFDIKPQDLFDFAYLADSEELEKEIFKIVCRQSQERKQLLYRIIKAFDV